MHKTGTSAQRVSCRGVNKGAILLLVASVLLSGCAAFRSEVSGKFAEPVQKNYGAERVSVFFLFKHLQQQHGFDSIPKLQFYGVKDFDNIFRDALGEISNIASYDTFAEKPDDVNKPERRKQREDLRGANDYTLEVRCFEESSFKQQFFSGTISFLTLTLFPMPYSWDYTIAADLYDKDGKLVRSYERKATLDNWVELFLLFAYPFHPLEGKREEIYAQSLHDIFRQIETEKVLAK